MILSCIEAKLHVYLCTRVITCFLDNDSTGMQPKLKLKKCQDKTYFHKITVQK